MVAEFPRAVLSCINGRCPNRPLPAVELECLHAQARGGGEWSSVTGNMLTNLTNHKMPPMVPTKRPHQDGSSNRGSGALGRRPMAGRRGGRLGCNPAPSYPCRGGSMGGRARRPGGGWGGGGGGGERTRGGGATGARA